jgi:hypothetical protein
LDGAIRGAGTARCRHRAAGMALSFDEFAIAAVIRVGLIRGSDV